LAAWLLRIAFGLRDYQPVDELRYFWVCFVALAIESGDSQKYRPDTVILAASPIISSRSFAALVT